MSFTASELWAIIHGVRLGGTLLLTFAGVLADLWSLRAEWTTVAGIQVRVRCLLAGTWLMAIMVWLTVITGTYLVYPWYRAKPPAAADLMQFPQAYLLANPGLAAWHTFGMEWKEHIAWLSPILTTAVAYVLVRYGSQLAHEKQIRQALMVLFSIGFLAADMAGLFGIFITKVASVC